jgi:hypothetical protein
MRYEYLTIITNEHFRAFMVMIMGERANLGLAYEVVLGALTLSE